MQFINLITISVAGKMFLFIVSIALSLTCLCAGFFRLKTKSRQHKTTIFQYMLGLTLEPKFTSVTWEWKDPHVVGESMSFFVKVHYSLNVIFINTAETQFAISKASRVCCLLLSPYVEIFISLVQVL